MDEKQLHGKVGMENKASGIDNAADNSGDIGKAVREAVSLDYLEGEGGVAAEQKEFDAANKEFIVLKNPADLYPE